MSEGLIIRKAGPADAEKVALLMSELNETVGAAGVPKPYSFMPEYARLTAEQAQARMERMKQVETVLVAELAGEPAGLTSLRVIPYLDQDAPYAEITQMHVRPEYRRRGVGARLIGAAEQMALDAGATCVHIITGRDNVDASAFYSAVGYNPICVEFEKHFPERPPANA